MSNSMDPIVITLTLDASVEKVWQALTELEHMKEWYFEALSEFETQVGFTTNFTINNEGRTFTHQWTIIDVEEFSKLTYEWTFKEYEGLSTTEFITKEKGEQTELQLTATVINPFPDDIPEFKRESGVNGWNYLLNNRLKNYLES